jgi:hypothetical protein
MKSAIDRMSPISGATGLDLSVSALRNFQRLSRGEDLRFPRIRATFCSSWRVFAETLEIDHRTAQILFNHAHWGEGKPLEGVEGLSDEIVKRARLAFEFDDDIADS